jgi:acyl-CoA reductase-like NAD-dependent aldehyde dehydrogenase
MSIRAADETFGDKSESLLIAGDWRRARDGRVGEVVSPVDWVEPVRVAAAGPADLEDAVGAAREAFDEGPWPRMPGRERAQILYDAADLVEEETGRLAWCQAVEMGKPVHFGEHEDGPFAAMALRFFAALASKGPEFGRRAGPSVAETALREPLGVVAALTGFHHPLAMAAAVLAAPLAMGDTVVLAPPAAAPVSVLEFAGLCAKAGLPPGVLNVVTGGREVLGGLAAHRGVDQTAYIGGPQDGRAVALACAQRLATMELDLGRPSAYVVFKDACLEHCAREVAQALLPGRAGFRATGPRILVHETVYAEFTERLLAFARELVPGDPRDPATRLGPLAGRGERERLAGYLGWSRDYGARPLGGAAAAEPGLYQSPKILEAADRTVVRGLPEVFAPLAFIAPFDAPAQAADFANFDQGSRDCVLYTADVGRGRRAAELMHAATCRICTCRCDGLEAQWPGLDEDEDEGGPLREFDIEAAYPFTRAKTLWIDVPM